MRVKCKIPQELKRLVSAIQRNHGDCEVWFKAYNKSPHGFTWFGHRMIVDLLYIVPMESSGIVSTTEGMTL